MAAKILLVLASALFVQSAVTQCISHIGGIRGCGYDGLGYADVGGLGCSAIVPAAELAASHGGGLSVSSASAAPPVGLAVSSDNSYKGCVGLAGNLPLLGTAVVEGAFPTAGASAVKYGCGDGILAITAEGPIMPMKAYGYDAGIGYGSGLEYDAGVRYTGYGGCGCGCSIL